MFRKTLILMGAFAFLGCSSGEGETDREKIISCAKLMNKRGEAVREKMEDGEESKDSKVQSCLALHEELAARDACLRENRSEPLEFYACVHERLRLNEKKEGGKGKDKNKRCGLLYDRANECSKAVKLLEEMGRAFGERGKFITECKKNWKEAESMVDCADKTDCKEFAKCLLRMSDEDLKKMEEMQRLADMPADAPAADPGDR